MIKNSVGKEKFRSMQKHPKIQYVRIVGDKPDTKTLGCYSVEENIISINVTSEAFKNEYGLYGFRGLVRDLSAVLIHELSHWATDNEEHERHEELVVMTNSYRSFKHAFKTSFWCLFIHSILYDLQRKNPFKKYFE